MSAIPTHPRLRPGLAAAKHEADPNIVVVWDQLRISHGELHLQQMQFELLQRMNGVRSISVLENELRMKFGDSTVLNGDLLRFVKELDDLLLLDSPRFADYLTGPVREPSCIGCYPAEPEAIRTLFRSHFVAEGGPGLPKYSENAAGLRAVLAPHIDYRRGGVSYAWAFKEVLERCDASLFVIIGTSHYSQERFTVTRQNFKTPLGIAPVDQAFVDQIETHYGDEIYNDPFAHYPEHSIELEVVYLQYLYENIRPFRIVPILVGSFRDCVEAEVSPTAQSDIRRMILALKEAEKAAGESVCYIISGDLAHIGPKFGDPEPVNEAQLTHSRSQDQELIRSAARLDLNAYFDRIAKEDDSRRICGLPPTVVALAAAEPASGRALDYGQYVHPQGHESVSFASIGFYR